MIRITLLVSSLVLGACVSTPATQGPAPVPVAPTTALASVPDAGLPPQQLLAGECGLFLWSRTEPRAFMFFSKAASDQAKVLIEGEPVDLRPAGAGGDIFGQFTTQMTFQTPVGGAVDLQVQPGDPLEQGQRVASGRIVITDAEGWETIVPVVGARACMVQ